MSRKEIGILLINNQDISHKELNKVKENFDKIQASLAVEQKNNRLKCPFASGDTMKERYG